MSMSFVDAALSEGRSAIRALAVRRGAELAQEHLPRYAARLALADAISPQFSTGATAVIAATTLVAGGFAGWYLHDLLGSKGKRR